MGGGYPMDVARPRALVVTAGAGGSGTAGGAVHWAPPHLCPRKRGSVSAIYT
jgi:hypothetical protein